MPLLDPERLRRLASDTLPFTQFDRRERFVPVRAEAWLTHATNAPWAGETDPLRIGAVDGDPRHRGTALCRRDGAGQVERLAGAPNDFDVPLGGDTLAEPALTGPDAAGLFLDFGGWTDPAKAHEGDVEYLYRCFSEVASAVNHENAWVPVGTDDNLPTFGSPQPPSPAVYCEIDWAGAHPRVGEKAGRGGDWAFQSSTALDGFLQVTYSYLFPARNPAEEQRSAGLRPLEGQWMAISLFYPVEVSPEQLDEHFRPPNIDLSHEARPDWVAFSVGNADNRPLTVMRRFGNGETEVWAPPGVTFRHVSTWVELGSHAFRWRPDHFVDDPNDPLSPSSDPWPQLDYEPGSDAEGTGPTVGLGSVWEPLGVFGLPFALLAWLWHLLSELWDDDASVTDIPRVGEPDYQPDAAAGHPGAAPPAPGPPSPDGFATNGGSPDGYDIAYFDIRVISHLRDAGRGEPDLQPPPYWDYAGRWGIDTIDSAGRLWDSGTLRRDPSGRTWAYWHANELLVELARRGLQPPRP